MPAVASSDLLEESKCYACYGASTNDLLTLALLNRIYAGGSVDPGSGYLFFFQGGWEAHNLGGPVTYYYGGDIMNSMGVGISTYANPRILLPKSGYVRRFYIKIRITTVSGTAQTVSHFIRQNDTTDFAQFDTDYTAVTAEGSLTNLNEPVTAGDYLALKVVTPLWTGTVPAGVRFYSYVLIEPTSL